MQLGKKSMQASLLETLKNDEGVKEIATDESISQQHSVRPSSSMAAPQQTIVPPGNEEG